MRWSDVLTWAFFRIGLDEASRAKADLHFSGAAHHRYHFLASPKGSTMSQFHGRRYLAHLRALLAVVYEHGRFDEHTLDESLRNMDLRSSWNPDAYIFPDWSMFDGLPPDRYGPGLVHPLDRHLKDLRPPAPASLVTDDGAIVILGVAGAA